MILIFGILCLGDVCFFWFSFVSLSLCWIQLCMEEFPSQLKNNNIKKITRKNRCWRRHTCPQHQINNDLILGTKYDVTHLFISAILYWTPGMMRFDYSHWHWHPHVDRHRNEWVCLYLFEAIFYKDNTGQLCETDWPYALCVTDRF